MVFHGTELQRSWRAHAPRCHFSVPPFCSPRWCCVLHWSGTGGSRVPRTFTANSSETSSPSLSSQLLRKQKKKEDVYCWSEHNNNTERGSSIWIPWDNLCETRGEGQPACLRRHRMPLCPSRQPFCKFGQIRVHAFQQSWQPKSGCSTQNQTKSEWFSYSLIIITLSALIHSYLRPFTNWYFVKATDHRKCRHPLVTGCQDHYSLGNESEKATFHQLNLV